MLRFLVLFSITTVLALSQIPKPSSGSGGGSGASTFDAISSGTNTGQTLVVSNNSTLVPNGTGKIGATDVLTGSGAPAAGDCNAAGEVGRVYINSDATASQKKYHVCFDTGAGTYAWVAWQDNMNINSKPGNGTEVPGSTMGYEDALTHGDSLIYITTAGANRWINKALKAVLRTHATDCTALTDGVDGQACYEKDSDRIFVCEPTAGGCDTAGEWILATGAGSGDSITVNGVAVVDPDFDDATPAPSGGAVNVLWQTSANNISAYVPLGAGLMASGGAAAVDTSALNSVYLPLTGGTLTGKLTTALTATTAGLRLTAGTVPSSPAAGDVAMNAGGVLATYNAAWQYYFGSASATGTSGGIPCFSSTTAFSSSGLLAAGGIVLGGGAGVCPATLANSSSPNAGELLITTDPNGSATRAVFGLGNQYAGGSTSGTHFGINADASFTGSYIGLAENGTQWFRLNRDPNFNWMQFGPSSSAGVWWLHVLGTSTIRLLTADGATDAGFEISGNLIVKDGLTQTERYRVNSSGLTSEYGDEATAGRGQSAIRSVYTGTGLSAAVASGNLLASAAAGTYKANVYIHTRTVPGATCTADVVLGWTYNGGAKTKTVVATHNLNSDEAASDNITAIKVDAATNITREITNTGTCGTYTYDAKIVLERID